MSFISNFLALFLESAPWLIFGMVLAGMLKMFISMSWMKRQLGGHGLATTIKAALLGAPLPLCSCGVIPAAIGLRRAGASRSATTSFMVATPETGLDSISVSYVLLGPFMAIIRPIAAIFSAILAGLLVGREDLRAQQVKAEDQSTETPTASGCCSTKAQAFETTAAQTSSCCSSKAQASETTTPQPSSCCSSKAQISETTAAQTSSCCSSKAQVSETTSPQTSSCCSSKAQVSETTAPQSSGCCSTSTITAKRPSKACCSTTEDAEHTPSVAAKIIAGLRYGATELMDDTSVWLIVGLGFAALVQTYVADDFLASWGNGLLAMLVMVIISIPMYICATASTPIAAGLLIAGVAPGAVLVFMLAGPATNIATLGVVSKELGKRALAGYLAGVLGGALLFGMLTDFLVATFNVSVMPQIGPEHELLPPTLSLICAIVLAILMLNSLIRKGQSKLAK